MSRPTAVFNMALALTLAVPVCGVGAGDMPDVSIWQVQADLPSVPTTIPEYQPHRPIVPRARVFSGTRGLTGKEPVILALVPDHVGYTIARQPALFWYLSSPTSHPITLTLIDTRSIQPILHVTLSAPAQPGVQTSRLKDYGITLEQNVQYRWYVSLVMDHDAPSRDIVTGGIIEHVIMMEGDCHLVATASKDAVHCYASAGLWYDAFAAISDRIATAPHDHTLRKQRAALLQQIDLPEVAEWDLRDGQTK